MSGEIVHIEIPGGAETSRARASSGAPCSAGSSTRSRSLGRVPADPHQPGSGRGALELRAQQTRHPTVLRGR